MYLYGRPKQQHQCLIVLIVFFLFFGSFVCQAQKDKKNPPTTQFKPGSTVMPAVVWGKIRKDGKGVPGMKVKLTAMTRTLSSGTAGKRYPTRAVTDKNGGYSFKVSHKYIGKKFSVTPQHPALPPGKHFSPTKAVFVLAQTNKQNFKFYPPTYGIKVLPKGPKNVKMVGAECRIHQILGPGKLKLIGQETGTAFKFPLDFDYLGKNFRVQVRHPMRNTFGVGFTPMNEIFKFKGPEKFIFVYNGPLPDLIISGINKSSKNQVLVEIKNIGNLAAGKFKVKAFYSIYTEGNKVKTRENIMPINGLAPNETADFVWSAAPGYEVFLDYAIIDPGGVIVESNRKNNTYEKKSP